MTGSGGDGDLRWVRADNPGPFTLDGTRTYVVGRRAVAVIDPGPDVESHVRALASLLEGAATATVVLTHGHRDHAGGVDRLLELAEGLSGLRGAVPVVGAGHARAAAPDTHGPVHTDAGFLAAVPTPGHTRDHLAWHWPERGAVFVGDHLLGRGDTTWVAEYPGCVADYLESLERLRALHAGVLLPTHGPPLDDPVAALDRFEAHRRERIAQVEAVRSAHPGASLDFLYREVYGDTVPPGLEDAARRSLEVLVHHVDRVGGDGVSSAV